MNCYDYSCYNNCCNYYGYCTNNYNPYDYYQGQCWYYYEPNNSAGIIAGIVVAGTVVLVAIVALVYYAERKKKMAELAQQARAEGQNHEGNGTTMILVDNPIQPHNYEQPQNNYGQSIYRLQGSQEPVIIYG